MKPPSVPVRSLSLSRTEIPLLLAVLSASTMIKQPGGLHVPPSSHFSGGLAFLARRGSSQVVVFVLWLWREGKWYTARHSKRLIEELFYISIDMNQEWNTECNTNRISMWCTFLIHFGLLLLKWIQKKQLQCCDNLLHLVYVCSFL